jgi:hypothetical protein
LAEFGGDKGGGRGREGEEGGGREGEQGTTNFLSTESFPPNFQDEKLPKRACSRCDDLLSFEILYTY